MSFGFRALSFSYENPSLSSAPGRKFSVTTSLLSISLKTISRPSGRCRSIARLFLLRLKTGKNPAPAPSRRRVLSPAGGSTLMTSAPRSASTRPQDGPITMGANSHPRMPSSGSISVQEQVGLQRLRGIDGVAAEIRRAGLAQHVFVDEEVGGAAPARLG